MRDFKNKEISIGDTIIFIPSGDSPNLKEGIVVEVKPKSVNIEYEVYTNHKRTVNKRGQDKLLVIKKANLLKTIVKEVQDGRDTNKR